MPMEAEYKTVLYEVDGRTAWITLNRPEKRNAQSDELRVEMSSALERAGLDPDVHIVVITGAGDQAFSAGADIDEFPTRPHEAIRGLSKPVIAMVNGLALGGGCELVLAADLAIAADTAKFGQPEIRVGVIPGCGGTQVLPRLMGEKRAKEFIFSGRMMDADEALSYGIVNKVVPAAELREATEKMVSDLLRNSPAILKIAKMAVNKSLDLPLTVGMDYEREAYAMCFGTADQKEGANAFFEKRKPEYTGK
jgi:enoyl-CoA hydratase